MAFYSFDTSAILNGRRDLLPVEVFPSLWANIEGMVADGQIRAIDVVRDELIKRDDDACRWAKAQDGLFVSLEERVQAKTTTVLAAHPKLVGVGGGRSGADPFVIALAMTINGGIVVTEELRTGNLDRPRIPDVCEALRVPWLNLMGFVRQQAWSF